MVMKRCRHQNPELFLSGDSDSVASIKTRSKAPKFHQIEEKMISRGMSSKILKEALFQQKEIEAEVATVRNFAVLEEQLLNLEEEDQKDYDAHEFSHFSETLSQYGEHEVEIDARDEKILEQFLSKDVSSQPTLADIIIDKIKRNGAKVSSEVRPMLPLDELVINLYEKVGQSLSKFNSGRIPKAFKHIPSMQLWEDVLYLTEPEKWSPAAMYEATRIFASNLGLKKVERFYKLVLLPRIRVDIEKNKKLHFSLHQALKKSLYKPAAFNKGILLPLCKSGTCTIREAVIVGSIIEKSRIPRSHSCIALLKLAEMEYCGTTSYFIKILLEKKYSLPFRVIDALVAHFMRFIEEYCP